MQLKCENFYITVQPHKGRRGGGRCALEIKVATRGKRGGERRGRGQVRIAEKRWPHEGEGSIKIISDATMVG